MRQSINPNSQDTAPSRAHKRPLGFTGKRVFKFQPPNNKAQKQAFFDKISSKITQILVRGVGPPPKFTVKMCAGYASQEFESLQGYYIIFLIWQRARRHSKDSYTTCGGDRH